MNTDNQHSAFSLFFSCCAQMLFPLTSSRILLQQLFSLLPESTTFPAMWDYSHQHRKKISFSHSITTATIIITSPESAFFFIYFPILLFSFLEYSFKKSILAFFHFLTPICSQSYSMTSMLLNPVDSFNYTSVTRTMPGTQKVLKHYLLNT